MINVEYRELEGMPDQDSLTIVARVATAIDDHRSDDREMLSRYIENTRMGLNGRSWIHLALAFVDARAVGYKLGRSDDPRSFESWRGGVLQDFRRRGIASGLSERQEAWCRGQGFEFMTTQTSHDNRPMLILNLQQGYYVAGAFSKRGATVNVALEKKLVPKPG